MHARAPSLERTTRRETDQMHNVADWVADLLGMVDDGLGLYDAEECSPIPDADINGQPEDIQAYLRAFNALIAAHAKIYLPLLYPDLPA